VAWSDSYHLSAHLRATPEEGGVGIWEVVFQKNPVTKRGHQLWDVVLDRDDGLRVKRRSGISVVPARTRGETEGPPWTLLPTRLYPTLWRFGVPTLSDASARNWSVGCEQIDWPPKPPHVTRGVGVPPYGRAPPQVLNWLWADTTGWSSNTAGCWMSMSPQVPLGTCPFLVRPVSQPWVGRRGRVQSPSDFWRKGAKFGAADFLSASSNSIPPYLRTTESTPFRQPTVSAATENLAETPPRSPAPVSIGGRSGVGSL